MKRFASLLIFTICFLCGVIFAAQETNTNDLNILTNISGDGSLEVFETWEMQTRSNNDFIERKIFVNKSKNEKVENVSVSARYPNVSGERQFELYSGDLKFGMYNVSDSGDYYFIRCGVDKFNSNLIYNISYTIKNNVIGHKDCAEMKWYIFKDELLTNLGSVSGEVYFPASTDEEVNAWLKTNLSNMQLKEIGDEKLAFFANNLAGNSYIELKTLLPNNMFNTLVNTSDDYAKDDIIQKEVTKIAEENAKREFRNNLINTFEVILLLILFLRLFNLIKVAGMTRKIKPTERVSYSKELPYDGITPGQALFIKKRGNIYMGNVFSAVLMSLKFKGVIDIVDLDSSSGGYIKILNQEPGLYLDEKLVFDFLLEYVNKFGKEKMQVSIKMLKMYISNNTERVNKLKKDIQRELKNSIKSFDESENKKISRYLRNIIYYLIIMIIMNMVHKDGYDIFTLHTWVSIVSAISMFFCASIAYNANVFSEKGENEREKIRAFQRYMLNFKEYGAPPAVAIWEYYLIFATAFGISDVVLKEIRENYINMGSEPCWEIFNICEKIVKSNFSKCFVMAISSK